jgi:hypothetical protein
MNKRFNRIFFGLLLGSGLVVSTGCVAPYYGGGRVAHYDYDYYPDADVYFYPHGKTYFWNEQGNWRSGGRLPEHYDLRNHQSQHLRLHSQQPWTEHHPESRGEH